MKTAMRTATVILAMVAPALAAEGGASHGVSPLVIIFLVFGALVIVFQLIPALMLVYGTLKGLFARMPDKAAMGISEGTGKN